MNEITKQFLDRTMNVPIKTFQLDEINEVHRLMEENQATGKMVVLV